MNQSMSKYVFTKNQLRLAEAYYQKGNIKGAIEIVSSLTFEFPNASLIHRKITQFLVAYEIHWRNLNDRATHYDVLTISRPFCSHQVIQRKYYNLVDKLCPEENVSVAAKSAFTIITNSWMVLSDPESRREYNIQKGFQWRIVHQPIMIVDSDSD